MPTTRAVAYDASREYLLSLQERAMSGFTHKFVIKAADINTSTWTDVDDDVTVALITTDTDFVVEKAAANVVTAFTASSALTMSVGLDGDSGINNIIGATDVKSAGPIAPVAGLAPAAADAKGTAADVIMASFLLDSNGAPANISTGDVHIFLTLRELNKW